ncbi:cell division protein ZapA [Acidipila sp. EB88]|uniref:cell division protein ZapA n=1 Tax=Acidipila sp. EB88 TaxID=2305226 RepID=UPI000F5E68A0|nr:cell division protein ZapA [Acidipila sp. EB88]RRA48402.1 cell division protein ZapA [Acidipila sp. EB88]
MSGQNTRNDGDFVTVSIYDQTYHLRGHDAAYIERLALLVDGKMRAVASHGTTVDSLRVAVLAALNIADELMLTNARLDALTGAEQSHRSRAHSLSGLLDEVLEDKRRTG